MSFEPPFKVWASYETTDELGRQGNLIGVFSTKDEAEKHAVGRGFYGGDGAVREKWAVRASSDRRELYLLESDETYTIGVNLKEDLKKLRDLALAKLSPDECRALGIEQMKVVNPATTVARCQECFGDGKVLEDHDGRAGYRRCSRGCK